MASLAVIILTKNEEKNIVGCVESAMLTKPQQVLVVDSGSTDATVELAKRAGANVVTHAMDETGFAGQRNFALEQLSTDWVFYLDADERITPEAAKDIQAKVQANEAKYYDIKRINVLFGQHFRGGGFGPDYSQRLYPRKAVRWDGVVHENAICKLSMGTLKGVLDHYPYQSWDKYFEKFNRYTTLAADKLYENGKRASVADMLLHPLMGFIRFYLLKQGFREGKLGLILAVYHFFYTMTKYVKLYYRQKEVD